MHKLDVCVRALPCVCGFFKEKFVKAEDETCGSLTSAKTDPVVETPVRMYKKKKQELIAPVSLQLLPQACSVKSRKFTHLSSDSASHKALPACP